MNIIDSNVLSPWPQPAVCPVAREVADGNGLPLTHKIITNHIVTNHAAGLRQSLTPRHFALTMADHGDDRTATGILARTALPIAALHEIHAGEPGDVSNSAAFTLLMAERARMAMEKAGREGAGAIFWVRENGDIRRHGYLYPPGVAELSIDPAGIIYIDAPDTLAALRAAADAARCSALGAVIIELSGQRPKGFDFTATRRLSLSAQKSGVPIFCLRHNAGLPQNQPSAAYSRWQVTSAPSCAMEAKTPGHPVFAVNLLRYRGGQEGFSAHLEWNRDERAFFETPDIGAVSALPSIGADRKDMRQRA